jgi:hypothetical protein
VAQTYSYPLGSSPSLSVGTTTLFTVPSLTTYVVRDIVATNLNNPGAALNGLWFVDEEDVTVWMVWPPAAVPAVTYHELFHQAFLAGDSLRAITGDTSWSVRVSGYELSPAS